jgi:20S proteasome subunit alpha 6
LFKVDAHVGIAVAGLTADGRVLCRSMRNECVSHRFVYDSPLAVSRLVTQVADRSQANTQRSWKRPFGVGLLVAGFDGTGPHLYQTCPSGNFYEYKAIAIGARSQAAKTYLEKTFTTYGGISLEELCTHALHALRESAGDSELTAKNASLAFVGKDTPFTVVADVASYLQRLQEQAPPAPPAAAAAGAAADDAMHTDDVPAQAEGGPAAME